MKDSRGTSGWWQRGRTSSGLWHEGQRRLQPIVKTTVGVSVVRKAESGREEFPRVKRDEHNNTGNCLKYDPSNRPRYEDTPPFTWNRNPGPTEPPRGVQHFTGNGRQAHRGGLRTR